MRRHHVHVMIYILCISSRHGNKNSFMRRATASAYISFPPLNSSFKAKTMMRRNVNSFSSLISPEEARIKTPMVDFLPDLKDAITADKSSVLLNGAFTINSDIISDQMSLAATLGVEKILTAPRHQDTTPHRPTIVGHRGAPYHQPENTLPSFLAAARELHCDAIELDVFRLKCGTLVVFHGDGNDQNPGSLESYYGFSGSILDYTAEEARRFAFDASGGAFACSSDKISRTTVPTLREVLEGIKPTGVKVTIELKGPDTEDPVVDLVEEMDMVDQCTFSSFKLSRIEHIRKRHPETTVNGIDNEHKATYRYKTGALFNNVPDNFVRLAEDVGASEVHLRYDTCTTERVKAIHDKGMKSMAWFCGPRTMKRDSEMKYRDVGNEDRSMYRVVMETGVDSLCVNRPDVLFDLLEAAQETVGGEKAEGETMFLSFPKVTVAAA